MSRQQLIATALLGALLAACGTSSSDPTGMVLIRDENNYLSTSSLSVPTVETAPATDLEICWSNIATDIQCHPVVPTADIDNVGFVRLLHLTQPEVEAQLISGELSQSKVAGYVQLLTDHNATCGKLSQFSFFGTPLDVAAEYQEKSDETYMMLFAHGTQLGVGARVMMFLKPTATSTNTRVDAPSGCGLLDFTADLTTPKALAIPTAGPWKVDWRNVTRNGQGAPVAFEFIDRLLIGFYQGLTVADIQAKFFDIETLATSLWELPLTGGTVANLANAVERGSSAHFAGFTPTDGVWLLGLFCSTCSNPAPLVLTVVAPSEAGK